MIPRVAHLKFPNQAAVSTLFVASPEVSCGEQWPGTKHPQSVFMVVRSTANLIETYLHGCVCDL
jgi:hypothetical protein